MEPVYSFAKEPTHHHLLNGHLSYLVRVIRLSVAILSFLERVTRLSLALLSFLERVTRLSVAILSFLERVTRLSLAISSFLVKVIRLCLPIFQKLRQSAKATPRQTFRVRLLFIDWRCLTWLLFWSSKHDSYRDVGVKKSEVDRLKRVDSLWESDTHTHGKKEKKKNDRKVRHNNSSKFCSFTSKPLSLLILLLLLLLLLFLPKCFVLLHLAFFRFCFPSFDWSENT